MQWEDTAGGLTQGIKALNVERRRREPELRKMVWECRGWGAHGDEVGGWTGLGKLTPNSKVLRMLKRAVIRSDLCFSHCSPSTRLWVLCVMRLRHTPVYISDHIQQRALDAIIWCSIGADWTCGKDAVMWPCTGRFPMISLSGFLCSQTNRQP